MIGFPWAISQAEWPQAQCDMAAKVTQQCSVKHFWQLSLVVLMLTRDQHSFEHVDRVALPQGAMRLPVTLTDFSGSATSDR